MFDKIRMKGLVAFGANPYWLENIATVRALQKKLKCLRKLRMAGDKVGRWDLSTINQALSRLSYFAEVIYRKAEDECTDIFSGGYFELKEREVLEEELDELKEKFGPIFIEPLCRPSPRFAYMQVNVGNKSFLVRDEAEEHKR